MWFDAHLDLATLAVLGRDMTSPSLVDCGGPFLPASATLTSLAEGNVRGLLATIFTEASGTDAVGYPAGNADAAHAAGLLQLRTYQRWAGMGLIELGAFAHHSYTALDGASADADVRDFRAAGMLAEKPPAKCAILMECADPIRTPQELMWWTDRGVVAIGLAWARGSRYAGGNMYVDGKPQGGLTGMGRELVKLMDEGGVIHDQAHLSDRATRELFEATDAMVIASHSNCRAIADPTGEVERHVTDETIREVVRRGGVIGLNLFSKFLVRGAFTNGTHGSHGTHEPSGKTRRATIDEALSHVEHICELAGHKKCVGLGSDLDGGLTANDLPEGINAPKDYELLAEGLRDRGWSDADVEGFAFRNWARVFDARGLAER